MLFSPQNEELMPFKEFLCTLQSSMADLHTALVEVNIAQLSDDLLELNLVELDKEVKYQSCLSNSVTKNCLGTDAI